MAVCALVGAAPFNAECFGLRYEAGAYDCVIAVDGGFASLEGVGCVPDVVMGDFDSLGYVPGNSQSVAVAEGVAAMEIFEYPTHKCESDMELALCLAQERGFEEVEVYGAIGGRLDHTIANLQLLASFSERGLRVTAIDLAEKDHAIGVTEVERAMPPKSVDTSCAKSVKAADDSPEGNIGAGANGTALTFLTGPAELTLEPHPGETVSVFSLSDESRDVTETGLAYPLDHVVLTNRTSWGLSNEFTDQPAIISVGVGTLVVFHPVF